MISLFSLLTLFHLIGLSIAVGAATLKVVLVFKCKADQTFIPVYSKVSKPITSLIITGMLFLTLSGIGWLIDGYPLTTELIVKLVLVAAMWIIGPVIDNAFEPKFLKLAPAKDDAAPEFISARNKFLAMELIATAIFYIIIVMWILAIT